jgi:hypothetical protein
MVQRLKAMGFCLLIVGFGALVVLAGQFMAGKAREVREWPTVNGTLLHADTERESTADGPRVRPDVQYEYVVEGQTYTSTQFEPGFPRYDDRSDIAREVNPFQKGAEVEVYYNPAQPAEAYLVARPRGGIVTLAGYAVGLLGLLLVVTSAFGIVKVNPPAEQTGPPQNPSG